MKVLIVTKRLTAGGGATLLTALIIDALLKLKWEVKVVCYDLDPPDAFRKNLGIDLSHPKLTIEKINTRLSRRLRWSGYLDSLYLMHFVKRKKYSDYVLFSTWDEMDFGRKAIQYVHWVSHHPKTVDVNKPISWSVIAQLRIIYRILLIKLFFFDSKRVRQNISIFNSRFTKSLFEKLYGGVSGEIVYPPVQMDGNFSKKFAEREDGFVYSGRIVRDKNIHLMIEFIEKVRAAGTDIHFHVVGPILDQEYKNELIRKYPFDWIMIEGNKNRSELSEILGKHKYAIQARYIEPFGMAAAEAAKLGCLTFVPRRSGLVELLEDDSLTFENFSDLFNKFCRLRQDQNLQTSLSERLQHQFSKLTPEAFQNQIQSIFLQAVKHINSQN